MQPDIPSPPVSAEVEDEGVSHVIPPQGEWPPPENDEGVYDPETGEDEED